MPNRNRRGGSAGPSALADAAGCVDFERNENNKSVNGLGYRAEPIVVVVNHLCHLLCHFAVQPGGGLPSANLFSAVTRAEWKI